MLLSMVKFNTEEKEVIKKPQNHKSMYDLLLTSCPITFIERFRLEMTFNIMRHDEKELVCGLEHKI